jgi:hypothetical protein
MESFSCEENDLRLMSNSSPLPHHHHHYQHHYEHLNKPMAKEESQESHEYEV